VNAQDLFSQQEANRRRSRWLVIGFILFFAWLGFGGDFIFYQFTLDNPPEAYHHTVPWLGLVLTVLGAGLAWYSYKNGPQEVLKATGAWELITPDTEEQRRLVNVVEEMAIAAGIPRPGIWIVPEQDPNAFATGLDPKGSHIAVTEGLLTALNRDELQAVVAHEMGHIKNLDVKLMTLLAALVGVIALVADGMGRMMRGGVRISGGGGGRRGGGNGKGGNALIIILLVVWIISWILAPIITRMLALGVSRKREFLADASGAQFTRNPLALAAALEKIEQAHAPTLAIKHGAAHLCIADPTGRRINTKKGFVADLLGTHPPMYERLARLKAMAYQEMKRSGTFPASEGA
jgi:heat shock protein HtpX